VLSCPGLTLLSGCWRAWTTRGRFRCYAIPYPPYVSPRPPVSARRQDCRLAHVRNPFHGIKPNHPFGGGARPVRAWAELNLPDGLMRLARPSPSRANFTQDRSQRRPPPAQHSRRVYWHLSPSPHRSTVAPATTQRRRTQQQPPASPPQWPPLRDPSSGPAAHLASAARRPEPPRVPDLLRCRGGCPPLPPAHS
jgi:hypothetical protein